MALLTYHKVPHPGYVDFQESTADKPEGVGWNNLGKRRPKFIAWHRMWGTLRGTDSHFGNPRVPSLTDYGIGCEPVDGKALAGVIHKYNNPLGYRSGWASGRVSAPYGDGKCIVDKFGVIAVNRDGVSIETSGYDEPFDDFSWNEFVHLCAYWIDFMEIPYDVLPLNPHTGCNAIIWHEEFTFGTGKKCPFAWMKSQAGRLYEDVGVFLKPYQTGQSGKTEAAKPETPDVPAPKYAEPKPIAELVQYADDDEDNIAAIVTTEANKFYRVADMAEAVRDTPRLQYAYEGAKHVGPDIKKGEQFEVDWLVTTKNGDDYYISGWWTRTPVKNTKRVRD